MSDSALAGKTITIDGKQHELSNLSENARAQVMNLRVTDDEIRRLNARLAIFQTARMTYAKSLIDELEKTQSR